MTERRVSRPALSATFTYKLPLVTIPLLAGLFTKGSGEAVTGTLAAHERPVYDPALCGGKAGVDMREYSIEAQGLMTPQDSTKDGFIVWM